MTFQVLSGSLTVPEAWFWSWDISEMSCIEMWGPYFVSQLLYVVPHDCFVVHVGLQLSGSHQYYERADRKQQQIVVG
jgi:hypothetical protein